MAERNILSHPVFIYNNVHSKRWHLDVKISFLLSPWNLHVQSWKLLQVLNKHILYKPSNTISSLYWFSWNFYRNWLGYLVLWFWGPPQFWRNKKWKVTSSWEWRRVQGSLSYLVTFCMLKSSAQRMCWHGKLFLWMLAVSASFPGVLSI